MLLTGGWILFLDRCREIIYRGVFLKLEWVVGVLVSVKLLAMKLRFDDQLCGIKGTSLFSHCAMLL